jgi:hypothetical protein
VLAHQSPTFGSDVVIMSMIFTIGTPVQVGACFKNVENTLRMVQDVLHIGNHLRRTTRASKPSWRPNQVIFKSVSKSRRFTKTDAQVAYGLGLLCSLYGWKDNFIKNDESGPAHLSGKGPSPQKTSPIGEGWISLFKVAWSSQAKQGGII